MLLLVGFCKLLFNTIIQFNKLFNICTVFAGDKAAALHRPHPNFDISKSGEKKGKKRKRAKQNNRNFLVKHYFFLQMDNKFINILIIYRKFS